jgi:hypothetical protein
MPIISTKGGGSATGFGFSGGKATFQYLVVAGGGGGGAGRPGTQSGGGGGAGAEGGNATNSKSGNGGNGSTFSISGTSTTYAGGGGGGSSANGGDGGAGGGAAGTSNGTAGGTATANTGGGGGGGWLYSGGSGGAGGSGIVIVRYPGLPAATGGTITYLNGYTIHIFTSSGTFTPYLWNDVSGEGNNAILENGTAFNSYKWGGYMDFTEDFDFATAPSSADFAFGTGDFTLECWVYPIDISTNYLHMIALPSQGTFALKAEINTGNIYFYSPSFTTFGSTTGWTLTLNTWNHVMLTRVSNVAYAYLNGISKGSKSGFNNSFSAQVLNIHYGQANEFTRTFMGSARIYNRGLSQAEVTQNYNAQKSRFGL